MATKINMAAKPNPENFEKLRKEMEQIKEEFNQQLISNTFQRSHKICYPKCVIFQPGSVNPRQRECLAKCVDRYLEAFNIVSGVVWNAHEQALHGNKNY